MLLLFCLDLFVQNILFYIKEGDLSIFLEFQELPKGDFNFNGGPYKTFQMILLFVTKAFHNVLVFKILNEGFMVNQQSKRVTIPKLEL